MLHRQCALGRRTAGEAVRVELALKGEIAPLEVGGVDGEAAREAEAREMVGGPRRLHGAADAAEGGVRVPPPLARPAAGGSRRGARGCGHRATGNGAPTRGTIRRSRIRP